MNGSTPTRKVGAGALAGGLTVILAWSIETFAGVTIPAEVASAGTTVITFAVGWFVSDA